MNQLPRNWSGLLVDLPSRPIQRSDLLRIGGLTFEEKVTGSSWERFSFSSSIPLIGEDTRISIAPYEYPVICRRSGTRLLALSVSRTVIEHLLTDQMGALSGLKMRPVSIGVDQLVKNLALRPTSYALSFAHARVPAFGASLRAISFYGEDLAEAAIFREQLELMVFYTCGLREAQGGPEVVRLSADGHVYFQLLTAKRVLDVENALAFLREQGYLGNEFSLSEGDQK